MLATTSAFIGFGIWCLITIACWLKLLSIYNTFGLVLGTISPIIAGTLIFTQSWNIFMWYGLIMTPIVMFLPLTKIRNPLSVAGYFVTIAFSYTISFGGYGLIHLLNKP